MPRKTLLVMAIALIVLTLPTIAFAVTVPADPSDLWLANGKPVPRSQYVGYTDILYV